MSVSFLFLLVLPFCFVLVPMFPRGPPRASILAQSLCPLPLQLLQQLWGEKSILNQLGAQGAVGSPGPSQTSVSLSLAPSASGPCPLGVLDGVRSWGCLRLRGPDEAGDAANALLNDGV